MAEGGEKTERATPRQRRRARERGQVAKSSDLTSALSLLALFLTLWLAAPRTANILRTLIQDTVGRADEYVLTLSSISTYGIQWTFAALNVLLPFFAVAVFVGLFTQFAQTGLVFSAESLKLNLSKLSPIKGFQRIFSVKGLVEMVKSLAKLAIIIVVVYGILKTEIVFFPQFINADLDSSFDYSFGVAIRIGLWSSVVLLILAILDYTYQVYEFEKSIKMSKQEVKDELKTLEGDPLIKQALRRRAREIAFSRMLDRAAEADVLITNPNHYSVAIVYELGMPAPRVTAKGVDYLALRMRDIARENNIAIVEDPPLARALYRIENDDFIPVEHFKAVAEILAFVARQDSRLRMKITEGSAA